VVKVGSKNAPGITQDFTKPTGFSGAHKREHFSVKDKNQKKVARVWKPKRQKRRLVIGMDVGLEETCRLSLCALVGRFAYKTKSNPLFVDWMEKIGPLTRLCA
jgi:hypothetical protein